MGSLDCELAFEDSRIVVAVDIAAAESEVVAVGIVDLEQAVAVVVVDIVAVEFGPVQADRNSGLGQVVEFEENVDAQNFVPAAPS